FLDISIKKDFNRYNPIERIKHELAISDVFWAKIQEFNPDHSIFSNVPLIAMSRLAKRMQGNSRPYLFWWQDVYSLAMGNALKKYGSLAWPLRQYLISLEKNVIKGAQSVVAISPNFKPIYCEWKQDPKKFSIYPNWTPTTLFSSQNHSRTKTNEKKVVYAGTLGLKHRPELLLGLADDLEFRKLGGIVVVVSQGYGRTLLEKQENRRENIHLKDFLPIPDLAKLFSEASILLAVLEPEASTFSVPSKIMSYLSAGKPIVASIDQSNASALILKDTGAGIVVEPKSPGTDFSNAVTKILLDNKLQLSMREASLKYSRENFDGSKAADFFMSQLVMRIS
ncbi:MAG: glycosyltransferase, partial [Actinobacteria bacterium]|nr:glycosyltransferase [Actinomycetota bacterium]